MSKATVGDFIVDRLQQWGIDRVFGYSGDGINGVMMLVTEWPMRYAACVSSGLMPTIMNIGMKIGANIAYFADIDPMNRLKIIVTPMKSTINIDGDMSA